jgi:hypothetical protein
MASEILKQHILAFLAESLVALVHQLRNCDVNDEPPSGNPVFDSLEIYPELSLCRTVLAGLTSSGELLREVVDNLHREHWSWRLYLCIRPRDEMLIGFGRLTAEPTSPARRAIYYLKRNEQLVQKLVEAHRRLPSSRCDESPLQVSLAFASVLMSWEFLIRNFVVTPADQRDYRFNIPMMKLVPRERTRRRSETQSMEWCYTTAGCMYDAARTAERTNIVLMDKKTADPIVEIVMRNYRRSRQRQSEVFQSEIVKQFPYLQEHEDDCHLIFVPTTDWRGKKSKSDYGGLAASDAFGPW